MALVLDGSTGITSANIADGTIVNADIADVAASKLTGTFPNFRSTGIDDNSNALAITIDSSENVGIGSGTIDNHGGYSRVLEITGATEAAIELQTGAHYSYLAQNGTTLQIRNNASGGAMTFATTSTERMRIDSSGNVGIGTSSPTAKLDAATATAGWGVKITNTNGASDSNGLLLRAGTGSSEYALKVTNPAESTVYMAVKGNGNVLVGTTSSSFPSDGFQFLSTNVANFSRSSGVGINMNRAGSDGQTIAFHKAGGYVGHISVTASGTSYTSSSDYRLKTDVQPMTGAITTFKQLKPVNFAWLVDGTRTDGFLAHELQEVIPAAATGTKDAMRDEEYEVTPAVEATLDNEGVELTGAVEAVMGTRSVPDMQGIDQAKIVPLLTAALQEAINKIESLETRLTALEGV